MGTPPACAKCKRGSAAEGDSWCSGCISLEGCTTALKGFWWSASHRRLAESILVQAGQQLRAVKNLDTTLQSFNDSWESRLRKSGKGGQKPPEPAHPPKGQAIPESGTGRRLREEAVKEEPGVLALFQRLHLGAPCALQTTVSRVQAAGQLRILDVVRIEQNLLLVLFQRVVVPVGLIQVKGQLQRLVGGADLCQGGVSEGPGLVTVEGPNIRRSTVITIALTNNVIIIDLPRTVVNTVAGVKRCWRQICEYE